MRGSGRSSRGCMHAEKLSRLQTSRLAELLAKAKLHVENLTALFKNYAAPLRKF